jgi:proton-dependent oligopeptide transporter, POT family
LTAAESDPGRDAGWFGQPRGLSTLFFTELWERFSYFGMRAFLMYFMVAPAAEGGLGFGLGRAGFVYGTYTMCVYLLAIPGGFVGDNFLGARRAVLVGAAVIAAGHFALAFGSTPGFFGGLALVAAGTGLLKPNMSNLVGALYPATDLRRDAGFSIFYMGINIGAFTAPFVTGFLAQSREWKSCLASWGLDPMRSWHWAFGAAGVGMLFGLASFVLGAEAIARVGPPPAANQRGTWALAFGLSPGVETRRIAAVGVLFVAAVAFNAGMEQAGTTIALFCDRLTRTEFLGWTFPSSWFQALNPLFVIVLAPIAAWLWVRLGKRQPSSPLKFVLGLAFLGLAFLVLVPASRLTAGGRVSPWWLTGYFFVQTVGEICLCPVGLSTMTKLAPPRLAGSIMGIWYLADALGNRLAGSLTGQFTATDGGALAIFFGHQALAACACAAVLLALTPWVKRLMGGVR